MKKSLLLIALLAGAAHAEPSKEETINFLQEKLNTVSSSTISPQSLDYKISKPVSYKTYYSFEEVSPCVFEYSRSAPIMEEINKIHGDVYGHPKETHLFNASTLDPDSVEVRRDSGWIWVEVESIKNKKTITLSETMYDPKRDEYNCDDKDGYGEEGYKVKFIAKNKCITSYQVNSLIFKNILNPAEKNAPKVAKALRHLIKLCGGKPELF